MNALRKFRELRSVSVFLRVTVIFGEDLNIEYEQQSNSIY
jgi:hypothetical protein